MLSRLEERNITLSLDDDALSFLVDKGFHPDYGARPLKRAIEQQLEDPLAEQVLRGKYEEGVHLNVGIKDGKIVFEEGPRPPELEIVKKQKVSVAAEGDGDTDDTTPEGGESPDA